ncbi:MAG TPA: TetR family transcriptional regulator C-terminal domain-containing protein [Terriglobia bacterium]|nr:TetR family transcriptional regulator C-terminal domain-containing protein [Terriglobia bacterium]
MPAAPFPMSPRRANPDLTERRREALIKAAYAEILDRGVAALTIDAVVARAGTSKGGALHYFRTKDVLLYAVLEWLLTELDRTLADIGRSGGPPRALLSSEIEVLFHSAEVNQKLYRVLFDYVAVASRSERYRQLLGRFLDACRRRDTAIIEDGIRRREFRRTDAEAAASTFRALVDGYCLQWIMGPAEEALEVYRDRCKAALSALLRNP